MESYKNNQKEGRESGKKLKTEGTNRKQIVKWQI